jgi:hypothetical protein
LAESKYSSLLAWLAQPRKRFTLGILALAVLALLAGPAPAQTTSSIAGTVDDSTGAVVPGAAVVIMNEANKAQWTTTSNGEGFFKFAAIPPATYTLRISEPGFDTWSVTGIVVHPGDSLTVPKIGLRIGRTEVSVTVTAEVAGITMSSPEHSTLITSAQIQRLSTVGRDAAELVSILPGFTFNSGANIQNEGANYQTAGFGNGNVGSFGANGAAPQQGLINVSADGANLIDPGDMGGQISNINMDQVQEVKIQTSNFSADQAKGPIVVNAVGKAGGADYHGDLHLYARNYALNANDWLSNYNNLRRPQTKYLYPGGSLGGPVSIPGTGFNKSKRLVFWAGYEYYGQNTVDGLAQAFVPSPAMLGGDLSVDTLAKALNVDPTELASNCNAPYAPNGIWSNIGGICYSPGAGVTDPTKAPFDQNHNPIMGGIIPAADIDPAISAYTRWYPKSNHTPKPIPDGRGGTQFASEGFNYVQNVMGTNNGFQFHSRVDESLSETMKLYVTYNWEKVNSVGHLQNVYYLPGGTVPYPTAFNSNTGAHYLTLNLTKTLSTSLTNELAASAVYFDEPQQFSNSAAAQTTGTPWEDAGYTGGITSTTLYGQASDKPKVGISQLPRLGGWEGINIPSFSMGYVPASSEFLRKYSWNIADNVTKVYKTHSLKAGIYAEQTGDNEINLGSNLNGTMQFMRWTNCYVNETTPKAGGTPDKFSPGNEIANFMLGCPLSFSQDTSDPNTNLRFTSMEGYVTDEWKVLPRLTLTLGMRLSHIGPWTDRHGIGMAVWDPSELRQNELLTTITSDPKTWKGFEWHKKNPSIPVEGVPTRALFYSPRFGLAYDIYGNGKTVFRGGWGAYRSHDNRYPSGAANTAIGMQTWQTTGVGCTFAQLFTNNVVPCGYYNSASSQTQTSPFNVTALDKHDDKMPLTYNYNFTVDQSAPWKTMVELAYVGNQSSDLVTLGSLQNQNVIPLGSFFKPDPITGKLNPPSSIPQSADYRPYPNYQTINVPNHINWANYHSMQASLTRQTGSLIFGLNYTWSKALGVRGNWDTGALADPVNPHHDYGILSFDRRHVFNANYSWQEGNKVHLNRLLDAVANGWEISGISSVQAGPDLAVLNGSTSFNFSGGVDYTPAGQTQSVSVPINSSTWLGTSDYTLQPTVKCDPREGLKKNQFVNGSCFGVPVQGYQGVWNLPETRGPMYIKADMSVYKNFKVTERQNMQFRLSGFNFLNHPLTSFNSNNTSALQLQVGDSSNTATTSQEALQNATVVNPSTFGGTIYKVGQRILELGFKYNF